MGNGLPDWPRARSRALPEAMPPGPPHYRLPPLSLIFGRRLRRSLDDLAGRFTAGLGEDGQWQPVACGRKLPLRWLQPRLFMLAGWPQGSCVFSSGWCNITCGTAYGGCSVICGWVRVSKMLDQAASIKSGAWQRRS